MDTDNLIDNNLENALENIPQSFATVNMIYVKANINNVNVKMLVDSGAQKSIMPKKITTLCNLEHLIDKECGGEVSGICAKKNILGKIHMINLQLPVEGNNEKKVELAFGFTILDSGITLDDEEINIIFGLDMLVSYGAILDFKKRKMIIDDYEFDFLKQDEIDKLF